MGSKVFILDQTSIKKLLTVYKLTIPEFQRNFVWKNQKKEQLLDSLFRGFPIGAITLYEDEETYYVIDGLQRINTLNQYLSCPSAVISFKKFWEKVERSVVDFAEENKLGVRLPQLKKFIKIWYEKLNNLYEFEKMSILYNVLKEDNSPGMEQFHDLQLVEDLLDILKSKIEIVYDEIALIIYKGDKNDLPDLFKNINTGSVALSQYEILQSVWNGYILDKEYLQETYEAFKEELDEVKGDYEIEAVRDPGTFDIFKNIMGLNHMICCNEHCGSIFTFSAFKKLPEEPRRKKYYSNDSISFEIYSTLLCNSPNKIVRAVDLLFDESHSRQQISKFVSELNRVILEAIEIAIDEVEKSWEEMIESKYHSLYVLAGIVISRYDIDVETLSIIKTPIAQEIQNYCLDLEEHNRNNWFVDENRQVSFFNIKINELLDMKRKHQAGKIIKPMTAQPMIEPGVMQLCIGDEIIAAYSVKDFYRKIFEYLIANNVPFEEYVPYATGKKRYLINHIKYHINGSPFVAPINIGDYYVETHKSKAGAISDIYNFLETIGVEVWFVV